MIKITLFHLKDGTPKGFKIKGHAGYAEQGSDIVCSAVSSAAYLVANTILEIMKIDAEASVKEDGEMILDIPQESTPKTKEILLGLELHLNELREQYPQNVTITTTEV